MRGGQVIRTIGDDFEPRAFSCWAPVAVATIRKLPDTIEDRSIAIVMKRRLKPAFPDGMVFSSTGSRILI
jgi:hypothetical protein